MSVVCPPTIIYRQLPRKTPPVMQFVASSKWRSHTSPNSTTHNLPIVHITMSDRKLRQKEDYYGKLNYGSTFTLPDLNKKSRSINNATIQHSSYPILPLDLKIRKFETFLVKSLVSITNSTNDTRKKFQ